jgi:hypothetical protein
MNNIYLMAQSLEEAKEQIEEILSDLKNNEYSEGELKGDLEHAYHHLNYAWHIRNVDEDRAKSCSAEDFKEWSKFPLDEIYEYE